MDNLKMHTPDLTEENFKKLAEMFPNAVTETKDEKGEVVRTVDADVLRQEISATVVEGPQERYQFTWPDKKKSVILANQPIAKTLRLDRGKSVGRDGTLGSIDTENIYIEGDNLDALKLLQETYLGKVKMIYIDPPYNTGSDAFVYDDDRSIGGEEFADRSGQKDEDGNLLFDLRQNNEANGRFHTDWLNMLFPRLRIAKDLLSDDGIIFISIDDHEQENLKKICDEIFGAKNFVTQIAWQCLDTVKNDAKYFSGNHEYILSYAKSLNDLKIRGVKKTEKQHAYYKNYDNDPRGDYLLTPLHAKSGSSSGVYSYTFSNGQVWTPPQGTYPRYSISTLKKLEEDNKIYLDPNGENVPQRKTFLYEVGDRMPPTSFWGYSSYGSTRQSNRELASCLQKGVFQNPKPSKLIYSLIDLIEDNENAIILDFFSGSATTAHAVMQLNAEDGGNRKFILIQLPELCDEKSEAYKAGYKNICEIGENRIRLSGQKIKKESPLTTKDLDAGFRVFRVDDSNMKDVYYRPIDYNQGQIELFTDNIKPDRTPEDLLYQVMLDLGILISSKTVEVEIAGRHIFSVSNDYLIACFDSDITEGVITEIAKRKPFYAVFRDNGIANDSVMANFEQIFETYSPNTQRKVL